MIIEGTSLIFAAGGISRLLALLSAPILTRLLGPAPYGVVAFLGTVTSFATMAGVAGTDHSYARYFFDGAHREREDVERFCWRFSITFTSIIALAVSMGWWMGSVSLGLPRDLAIMVAAGIGIGTLNTMAVTRQRLLGAYARIAWSLIGSNTLAVALAIILAYAWRQDAWALLLSAAVGNAAGVCIVGLPSLTSLFRKSGLSASRRIEILRLGLAGSVIGPMYWLMNSVDRWLIGAWQGPESLGVYAFAQSVSTIGLMLNSAITLTWFPEMMRLNDTDPANSSHKIGRMWVRMVGLLLSCWLTVSAFGGDLIRLVAAPLFHNGATLVPWLAGGVFFYGIASLANTGPLLSKRLGPVAVWWIIGAIVNTAVNLALVKSYNGLGAAIAGCFSYAVVATGVMTTAQAVFHLCIPWGRLGGAAGFALTAGVALALPWAGNTITSMVLKFSVGLVCMTVMWWIIAPDWIARCQKRGLLRSITDSDESRA